MLDRIHKIARISLLGAITAVVLILGYHSTLILRQVERSTLPAIQQGAQAFPAAAADVHQAAGDINSATTDLHALVLPTQKLLALGAADEKTTAQLIAQERDAFAAQQKSYEMLTQQGAKVLGDADATIGDFRASLVALPLAIQNFSEAGADAAALLGDPANRATLANIQTLTAQSAGIATDAHIETGILVAQTRQALAPKNKFLTIAKMAFGGTLSVAELAYYLSK